MFIYISMLPGKYIEILPQKSLQYAVSTANQIHLENVDVADLKPQKYIHYYSSALFS